MLDLALLPHHGHQGGGDHQDDMGEHWHPGVGADGPRPKGVVSSLGAACQDVACIEKAAWGALPTRVAQLPALSLVPENLDDYDSDWMAANKRHIQTMAVIGQKLQNGVSMPLESVLQETDAALLEDEV